jgi:hypothetical protein
MRNKKNTASFLKSFIVSVADKACFFLFAMGMLFLLHSQTLSGKVIDEGGAAIKGVLVQLAIAGRSDTSGDDGTWSITIPSGIEPFVRKALLPAPALKGTAVYFAVNGKDLWVQAGVYEVSGRLVYNVMDRTLAAGFYTIGPLDAALSPGFYLLRIRIGRETHCFRLLAINRLYCASGASVSAGSQSGRLAKMAVTIDTVKVSKAGYLPAAVPIGSYSGDPLVVTLIMSAPAYYLNPPNPCYNQFYVQNCVPGNPNSACGGNCTVANACSPPEDPNKANQPKTFVCPRFMLYSTEMLQAAKDDAALYGWGNDPPFTYGVVGHDADVGGLDQLSSSCCQCYQIVYVTPETSSPQPPSLPYPKPLVVQSFNTAAGGPKGFDVFMAAGGYGAFNSCYKDASFGNTTKFNEFMYDSFPYQNPGSGGISFLRFPECIKGWPPTVDGVLSAACQDKIKQMCNQALMNASTQITEDTRRSCIMCNQLESLYHQNWQVMVKRVRCPQNLTRVTGCRLVENNLPLPLPNVQTPADAKTDGTFASGYNTTTMQDCCKPTCAWADWTSGQKLPVDSEWNSFYSCDKNGKPITK